MFPILSGKPRGFIELWRSEDPPLVLFKPADGLRMTLGSRHFQSVSTFVQRWHAWLLPHWEKWANGTTDIPAILDEGCREFIASLLRLDDDIPLLTTQPHAACPTDKQLCQESFQLSLVNQIETMPVHSAVATAFTHLARSDRDRLRHVFPVAHGRCEQNCAIYKELDSEHFVSFLLASWPSPNTGGVNSNKPTLNQNMFADLTNNDMQKEVVTISRHLFVLIREMYT